MVAWGKVAPGVRYAKHTISGQCSRMDGVVDGRLQYYSSRTVGTDGHGTIVFTYNLRQVRGCRMYRPFPLDMGE